LRRFPEAFTPSPNANELQVVQRVLIVAREEIIAALLGLLIDLQGYTPVFAERGETPAAAVARLAPSIVIVDCDHPVACTDEFFETVSHTGRAIVLFSPSRLRPEVRHIAAARKLTSFALPIEPANLGLILEQARATSAM
jgi:AmiR/NasT family two-component response regulator